MWFLLYSCCHVFISTCRLSNRSMLPRVPDLKQKCGLILSQIASYCKKSILKMDGEYFQCFAQRYYACTLILLDTCNLVDCLFLQITKEEVDIYKPGRHIPSCELKAVWTKSSKPSPLIHKVTLNGAKPSNFISIYLDCDSIPLGISICGNQIPNYTSVTFIGLCQPEWES